MLCKILGLLVDARGDPVERVEIDILKVKAVGGTSDRVLEVYLGQQREKANNRVKDLLSMGGGVEFVTVDEGNGVQLSARLYKPLEGSGEVKNVTVVLVHQYSVLGGCQGLMKGMADLLSEKGYLTVTFDQRGAGRSTGRSTLTGSAEVNDVVAVCRWVAEKFPTSSILLVGSSAGAPIAGSAVDQVDRIKGYVGLGYPFGFFASILFGRHNKTILTSEKPKLFVMGTRDGFTSVKQLENKLKTAPGRTEKILVPGVGHFEMEGPGYDEEIIRYVVEFAESLDDSS